MSRDQLEGAPWGSNVDPDEAYLRGQATSVGSGLLGGWSQASYGGAFAVRKGNEKEIRREIAELNEKHPPKLGPSSED
ncbi:MAG TPA: hypothetical protein VN903_08900 [Polyangia bacterium]|jgi:hypothetical protein|nr:hypothetical protein [Polyangia bacterium]